MRVSRAARRWTDDQGVDIKTKRGGGGSDDDSSEEEDEERRQSLREEIERKYYPECAPRRGWGAGRRGSDGRGGLGSRAPRRRYDFWPFGDPFIHKRKREERKRRQSGRRQWYEDDD